MDTNENVKTVRIFISSPGDVQEERERARGVIHQLRRRYAGRLDLRAILWEELPLQADTSFQEGIDVVLSKGGVDIAVFILWSRLGSPTGFLMSDDGGREYRSGTEREWDLMLRARDRCIREGSHPRPAIIVYTRKDDVSFEERLRGRSDDEKTNEIEQKKQVNQFVQEEFQDSETGKNLRAFHSFDQPTTFAKQLRIHLTGLLDSIAGEGSTEPVWNIAEMGPPFRGLDVFEFEHGPIFFGREDETVAIRTRLCEQARKGCAFMLICGPSGSGKSSLARAGVLPDICNYEIDASVRGWRRLAIKPASLGGNLLQGLVDSLVSYDALPELSQWKDDIAVPEEDDQFSSWLARFQLRLMDALKLSGKTQSSQPFCELAAPQDEGPRANRLILLVDQLEELFSNSSINDHSRKRFFETLEALARCGAVWVLATVRSDFYQQCQAIPALVRIKEAGGHFDLLPPTPDGLARVITGPATLAGLTFEREGERVLSDAILAEAAERKELLPLVEHLLLELCDRRTDDGMLTFAEFSRVGGVEGALRRRCEEAFSGVSDVAKASLDDVLTELVTLSGESREDWVRRTVPVEQIATSVGSRELIDAMIAARLFTASTGPDRASVVSVAHETLLRVWPRIVEYIHRNREFLRLRATVELSCARWSSNDRAPSLQLPEGLPLEEGRRLLDLGGTRLGAEISEFIEQSICAAELHRRKAASRRRALFAILSAATMIFALLGFFSWSQSDAAKTALATVESQKKAVDAALIEKEEARANEEKARIIAEERREEAEATLARSNFLLAKARWAQNRESDANELLGNIHPKYRGIEWRLVRRRYQRSEQTLFGHRRDVSSVAFSPDGSRLASSSYDKTIKLWDAITGEEIQTFAGHQSIETWVAFSPAGPRLASRFGPFDNSIKLWDAITGEEIQTFVGHQSIVTCVAFSPDGEYLATGANDKTIKLWDVATGEEICTIDRQAEKVVSIAFSPDGLRLASGSFDKTITLWNATTGEEIQTFTGHQSSVNCIAFSPDGLRLASGSNDYTIKLWDATTGEEIHTLAGQTRTVESRTGEDARTFLKAHSRSVTCVAFSPDGSRLASGSYDKTIKLWDVATGELIRTIGRHVSWVNCIAFSPDGSRLASGSSDKTIQLWDAATGEKIRTLAGHRGEVTKVTFSQDGLQFASCGKDWRIKLWDTATLKQIRTLEGHSSWVNSVSFSPDGSRLASGSSDKTIKLWDATTGAETHTLAGHQSYVNCIAFSPDGSRLASGSSDKTINVWDTATGGKIRSLAGHQSAVNCIAFSPDGSRLVSGSYDRKIKLWDPATGREIHTLTGHQGAVNCIAFSPDGECVASGADDKMVMLWNAATGKEARSFSGHLLRVSGVAFSDDGSRLVSASLDGSIRLWDRNTGEEIHMLLSLTNPSPVTSLSLSPNAESLVSGSLDGEIKLWDAPRGEETRSLTGHQSDVTAVAFHPNGSFLASGSTDDTIKLWDAATGEEIQTLAGHQNAVTCIAFSPDGESLASGSRDSTIRLWDVDRTGEFRTLDGHVSWVKCIAFSPDGLRLASGSRDSTIRLWDVDTGKQICTLYGHQETVDKISFSAGGRKIFSESFRERFVWSSSTGQRLKSEFRLPLDSQDCSHDGRWLAVPSGSDVILVDQQYKHIPSEVGWRQFNARPKPYWHYEQAESSGEVDDWYGAMFHWAHCIRAAEAFGRSDDGRFSDAPKNLENAYEQWRQSLSEWTKPPQDPDILLQSSVREVLHGILDE